MSLPEAIAALFFRSADCVSREETFSLAEWHFRAIKPSIPSKESLVALLAQIPNRDSVKLVFAHDSEPVAFNSSQSTATLDDFLAESESAKTVAGDESTATLTLTISKDIRDSRVSLYSLEAFTQTIKARTFRQKLETFDPCFQWDSSISIECADLATPFQTKTLRFTGTATSPDPFRRTELRLKRNDLCHSTYADLGFTPDDFCFTTRSANTELNDLIDQLCIATSLLFVADVSETSAQADRDVSFKLNGYRSVLGSAKASDLDPQTAGAWFAIYEWVYSTGGVSDKIGLARNIMSLHWKGAVRDLAEGGVLTSIRSGFEIYLKANVRQYIEVKNKLNDYLADFSAKAAKLADGLADKFEKNVTAFLSFFITSILAKVISDPTFTGVFNRPVTIIGLIIVGGSVLHFTLSNFVFCRDHKRLLEDWELLEKRYADLLDQADLSRIFDKRSGFNQAEEHLNAKRKFFNFVWVLLLVAATIILFVFGEFKKATTKGTPHTNYSRPPQARLVI